jgi:hypothetical protein
VGRALRIGAVVLVAVALILVGIEVGMFIRMNDAWVTVRWPVPGGAVAGMGAVDYEAPTWVLAFGWVVAALLVATVVIWLPISLTRRRQTRLLVRRLEREVAALRNLPITAPAPLEDLPDAAEKPGEELEPVVTPDE